MQREIDLGQFSGHCKDRSSQKFVNIVTFLLLI